jgi:hypothetical protein
MIDPFTKQKKLPEDSLLLLAHSLIEQLYDLHMETNRRFTICAQHLIVGTAK